MNLKGKKMLRFVVTILLAIGTLLLRPVYADDHFTQRSDVQAFIEQMVKKHGFKKSELLRLFSEVKVRPQVMRHINKPLEKEPWHTYQVAFVNEWRIQHGVQFWNKYANTLKRAEKIYGVPASIIVATIGIETKYGERTGEYRVMDSLSNIGFSNSPRASFFRKELEQFLLLTREQHVDPLKIMGSYAGAIGQPQFMPSSYRYYAVNFSNSGSIDLMHDEVDVIGSIANYYSKHGWKQNQPIAVQAVIVGNRFTDALQNNKMTQPATITELARYGVTPKYKVQHDDLKARVIELQNRSNKEYWLGFHNFGVIKRYNPSDLYAMAVYQLSAHIVDLKNRTNG
jgi:membrane-bound lytic murein transglycosylase B